MNGKRLNPFRSNLCAIVMNYKCRVEYRFVGKLSDELYTSFIVDMDKLRKDMKGRGSLRSTPSNINLPDYEGIVVIKSEDPEFMKECLSKFEELLKKYDLTDRGTEVPKDD